MTVAKKGLWNTVASLWAVGLLSATLAAQPNSAARYDIKFKPQSLNGSRPTSSSPM